MKILLAADGSAYTRHAVDYLIKHLGMFGGPPELGIVHVRPMIPGRAATALNKTVIQKYYADETAKALAPARRMLDKAAIPVGAAAHVASSSLTPATATARWLKLSAALATSL